MSPDTALAALPEHLDQAGFPVVGGVNRPALDELLRAVDADGAVPGWARSVVLAIQGGGSVWRQLNGHRRYAGHADPFEAYSRDALGDIAAGLERRGVRAVAWAANDPGAARLPLIRLTVAAGLGWVGDHGLLLHPHYGSWVAIRGVLVVGAPWPWPAPALGPRPCNDCPRPCLDACHGEAFAAGPGRWDAAACFATRVRHTACTHACPSRDACPVGTEHRYSTAQMRHHMGASLVTMTRVFGG